MVINNKFEIRQSVFLVTDLEQVKRLVTSIIITNNGIMYQLSCGDMYSSHYDFEISESKDVTML